MIGTAIAINLLIPKVPLIAGCAISIVDVLLIVMPEAVIHLGTSSFNATPKIAFDHADGYKPYGNNDRLDFHDNGLIVEFKMIDICLMI